MSGQHSQKRGVAYKEVALCAVPSYTNETARKPSRLGMPYFNRGEYRCSRCSLEEAKAWAAEEAAAQADKGGENKDKYLEVQCHDLRDVAVRAGLCPD
jgi:hypothetical protein